MACMTLKRCLDLDPTNNCQRKRAKFAVPTKLTELSCTPSKPSVSQSSPFGEVTSKLTPEKMAANIKEEAHRLSRRKQLIPFTGHPATDADSPGTAAEAEQKPLFTYSQIGLICERMLREQEDKIREEYEKILNAKLAEQYDTFVKFTHDQIQHKFKSETQPSYLS